MGIKFWRQNDKRKGVGPGGAQDNKSVEGVGGIADGSDVKLDYPHKISRDQLVPRIVQRSKNAVHVDHIKLYFYHRKQSGRRCSCWSIESPDSSCLICYNSGIVGGYTKNGTADHTIDVTHPNLRCINVYPNYGLQTRPVTFTLFESAVKGYVETDIYLMQNIGILDAYQLITKTPDGTSITTEFKSDQDLSFLEFSQSALESRLGDKKLTFRFTLKRVSPEAPLPILSHFFLRYRLREELFIIADCPRQPESLTLTEFGVQETFSTIDLYTANQPKRVSTEDFVHNLEDNKRFKVIESNPNRPLGWLTSHDLTCRLVQRYEPYMKVP